MKRTVASLLALTLAAAVATGCGKSSEDTTGGGVTGPIYGQSTMRQPVYFSDWQEQHLIPEERVVSADLSLSGVVAEVVKELLKGPTDPNLHRTIPAEVRLLDAKVEDDMAVVNLSRDVLKVRGAAAANQLLGSLTLTLTEVSGIHWVQILVEGETGATLDEGILLSEPRSRPFYGDIPFQADPNRTRYLQELVTKRKAEQWRAQPISVLRFEGRGFGFPHESLEWAYMTSDNGKALARIPYRGTTYLVELTQNLEADKNAVWVITGVTSHKIEPGAMEMPIFFADRQALNVIPEKRVLAEGTRGMATSVVEALLAGPTDPHLVRIFPAGTRLLRAVRVANSVATVDLSGEVLKLTGEGETTRMVNGLVYSLTAVEQVYRVEILIDGKRGQELGNFRFDEPIGRGEIAQQYHVDQERVAWLQKQVEQGQDPFRLDPLQTLTWEGQALGFRAELLKTATLEQQADRALASVPYRGRTYVIEMGKNPGEQGIWFVKGITAQ